MLAKMINILFFFMCLVTSSHPQTIDEMQNIIKEDLELERQLKLINKLPVKSIHTKFEYIVDCIDINKQPAFDHPLLKNHKLQRKPSFQQKKAKINVNNSPAKPKVGFEKVSCPTGTVPIRRTTKDDLIRIKSLLNTQNLITHTAEVALEAYPDEPYYAISGTNSIYNPSVTKDQTSAAHLWVENGNADGTNKIMVGWHVFPQLHGDGSTYTYSLWTSDNFENTGCYNLQCPGFVQIDKELFLGQRVDNTSIYGGMMTEMTVSLYQDANTKNWWLDLENTTIGYFPAALFSNMTAAEHVGWGGKTTTPMVGTRSPQMGSGIFPDENFVHASYFRYVTFQNESRTNYGPELHRTQKQTDRPNCYGVDYYGDQGAELGYCLQFGGPGGICDN